MVREAHMPFDINLQTFALPPELSEIVAAGLEDWDAKDKTKRLWARDASLWTGSDEGKWLGWLSIVGEQRKTATRFIKFAEESAEAESPHALLRGRGWSSL